MANKLTQDQLSKLINYLDGTCNTLEEALEKLFDLEYEDLQDGDFAEIDQSIFCCESCGWWQEMSCMAETEKDDWICEDCAE